MNKQAPQNTNSESSLSEAGGTSTKKTKSNLSSVLRKYKVPLCLVAAAVAAVIVMLCVALVVVLVKKPSEKQLPSEGQFDPIIDDETREKLLQQIADSSTSSATRPARMASPSGRGVKASCYSVKTNKTHPAAHISGQGFRWTTAEPGTIGTSNGNGYQTSWVCGNESDAFVGGGMYFDQEDQKLHVPTCGYYYVSSSIFFQSDLSASSTNSNYVRHQIYVERNCGYTDDRVLLRSYSSLSATQQNVGRTTTYIGSVVKMCSGGTISVIIPNDRYNPCCPYGRHQTTFLSAFMVTEASCEAQVVLDHPPTNEDIANANM